MVKFTGERDGVPLIGLGLSRENLKRLKDGQPIVVHLADLNLPPGQILIFYGTTEAAMAKTLLPHIGEDTIVYGTETLESEG